MTWFNEIDPFCAQWCRNAFGGEVDERDIRDIEHPTDAVRQHYFAGLGGWEWALRLAGWPEGREVWTGSCPCQPFSAAGKRQGLQDERDLWSPFFRLIAERRPEWVFGEQVEAAIGWGWLDRICDDLASCGYTVRAVVLPACSVGAPHIRSRLFWVALRLGNSGSARRQQVGRGSSGDETADGWQPDGDYFAPSSGTDSGVDDAAGARIRKPGSSESGSDWENDGIPRASGTTGAANGLAVADSEGRSIIRGELPANGDASCRDDADGSGEIGWLAFPESQQHGVGESGPRWRIESQDRRTTSWLEQPQSDGRGEGWSQPERRRIEPRCTTGGLGNAHRSRLQGYAGNVDRGNEPRRLDAEPARSPWAASQPIYCADGRWRWVPLEPGIQPLADGGRFGNPRVDPHLSSRIGALKAAGNAIVIPLAAEFIRAVMDLDLNL